MNIGHQFSNNIDEEWKQSYVDYWQLRTMVFDLFPEVLSSEETDTWPTPNSGKNEEVVPINNKSGPKLRALADTVSNVIQHEAELKETHTTGTSPKPKTPANDPLLAGFTPPDIPREQLSTLNPSAKLSFFLSYLHWELVKAASLYDAVLEECEASSRSLNQQVLNQLTALAKTAESGSLSVGVSDGKSGGRFGAKTALTASRSGGAAIPMAQWAHNPVKDSYVILFRRLHQLLSFQSMNILALQTLCTLYDDTDFFVTRWMEASGLVETNATTEPPTPSSPATTSSGAIPLLDEQETHDIVIGAPPTQSAVTAGRLSESPFEMGTPPRVGLEIDRQHSHGPAKTIARQGSQKILRIPSRNGEDITKVMRKFMKRQTQVHSGAGVPPSPARQLPPAPAPAVRKADVYRRDATDTMHKTELELTVLPDMTNKDASPATTEAPEEVGYVCATRFAELAVKTNLFNDFQDKDGRKDFFSLGIYSKNANLAKPATATRIHTLIKDLIHVYACGWEDGNVEHARTRLTSRMSTKVESRGDMFAFGVKFGVCVALFVTNILLLSTFTYSNEDQAYLPIFRLFGLLLCVLWGWGCCVWVWTRFRVNYVFIYEFNPVDRLSHFQIWNEAAVDSIIYLLCADAFFLPDSITLFPIDKHVYPLAMTVVFLFKLFAPFPLFSLWGSRRLLLNILSQIVIAPFGRITFRDAYVGDVLTSISKVLADLYYTICFYLTDWRLGQSPNDSPGAACVASQTYVTPLILILPLFWRFCQTLRQYYDTGKRWPFLGNSGKYFIALIVALMGAVNPSFQTVGNSTWGAYRVFWLLFFVSSTIYSTLWDLRMDWGLLRISPRSPTSPLLRKDLMFPKFMYYVGIVLDIILRSFWTLNIIPLNNTPFGDTSQRTRNILLPIFGFLEIFRRTVWSFFRIENAHVSRWDEFRQTATVPVFFDHTRQHEKRKQFNSQKKHVVYEVIFLIVLIITVSLIVALSA